MGLKKVVDNPYSPKTHKTVTTVDLRMDFRAILGIGVRVSEEEEEEEGGSILGFLGLVRSFKFMAHGRKGRRDPSAKVEDLSVGSRTVITCAEGGHDSG